MSIGSRLNLIVMGINVLILSLVIVIAADASDNALRREALSRFAGKAELVRADTNAMLTAFAGSVDNLAAQLMTTESLSNIQGLQTTLADTLAADADDLIHRVSVLRPDGSVGVLTLPNPRLPSTYTWRIYRPDRGLPVDDPAFDALIASQERGWFYQDASYFDDEGQPSLSLSMPLTNAGGDQIGLIWADLPVEALQRQMNDLIGNVDLLADSINGYVLLLDDAGRILSAHNTRVATEDLSGIPGLMQRLEATDTNDDGLQIINPDPITQDRTYISADPLARNAFTIISALPEDEVPVFPSQILVPVVFVSLLGLLALLAIISRFVQRGVVIPLRALGQAAQEIGSGDRRYHIGYQNQNDEIGQLARALEAMKRDLTHSYNELANLTRTLEQRVMLRTEELQAAQERAAQTADELRAIYDESLMVVNEPQLQPILNAVVERILTLTEASYCGVWLLNDTREKLQLVATNHQRDQERHMVIFRGEGIAGQAVERGQLIVVDDYHSYAFRVVLPDEDRPPLFRAMCAPLMIAGQPIGAVVVGRREHSPTFDQGDQRLLTLFANLVSPSVRNAQLLVQRNRAVAEAESANEVKTRFLASVTHELRTPLNLIINNLDFMSIGAFGDVTPEQVQRLTQTTRSAEHLLYLVNDLLDVSKIATGEMQLFIQPNDVYTMLEDSMDNARALLEKMPDKADQVHFRAEIDEGLPTIPMDVRRIRQVLTNLLSNALKFTESGEVVLRVTREEMGIHFSVADTGVGIPDEELPLLFEAFERTSQAKERQIEGTGLGLPISRYLVQQHASDLYVRSTPGEGSTFWFILPYEQPDPSARKTDTQIIAVLSSRTH